MLLFSKAIFDSSFLSLLSQVVLVTAAALKNNTHLSTTNFSKYVSFFVLQNEEKKSSHSSINYHPKPNSTQQTVICAT